ncbi:MAG: hypothetical protein JXR37_12820 [Kiritimatiellae bacterium]|nr:hypothetical protein [Kiritimatiellia bacterium]
MPGTLTNFCRELRSFWRFYNGVPKRDREIVFYAEDIASYAFFEGLIDDLTQRQGLKVCYVTSAANDPILARKRPDILPFYIKSLLAFFTVSLNSRVLIMTMPDLHRFHVRRSERGTHHIYMFHNIGSSFPVIRYGALFHYDTIFCVGPHHNEEIRRQEEIYGLPRKALVNFGYYRVEKVHGEYAAWTAAASRERAARATVLVGPSWGDTSLLNLCGMELVDALLRHGYRTVVRPHPMTRRKSPHVLDRLHAAFAGRENYVFADDIASTEAVLGSDLLISDWSGFAYEYAFGTGRPVLFIDVPQKIVNERYRDLGIEPIDVGIRHKIGRVLPPDRLDEIDRVISEMLDQKDAYVSRITEARDAYIYNFGSSSRVGGEYIRGLLA